MIIGFANLIEVEPDKYHLTELKIGGKLDNKLDNKKARAAALGPSSFRRNNTAYL